MVSYSLRDWLPHDLNAPILDLGCGEGRIAFVLAETGYTAVTGVDISDSQLALARQTGGEFHQSDALAFLEAPGNDFALILSTDLIEHLPPEDAPRLIERCAQRLAPGGRLVIQTPNPASPFFGQKRYGDLTHITAFTPGLLARLFTNAGLHAVSVREVTPVPWGHSIRATLRWAAWQALRLAYRAADTIETGSSARCYSQVFSCTGIKRQ
jgi:O-antigen chain-terminating methyltransferase